jgi:oxygen-independent coproporphyrinogen-3 oxidase
VKPYFEALKCEMELYREKLKEYTVITIYIGGGTPSFVDTHYIYEAINLCHSIYTVQRERK